MPLELIRAGTSLLRKIDPELGRLGGAIGTVLSPVKEPQKSFMWEVEFVDPFGNMGNLVKFYCKATGIPPTMNETIKRYHAGVQYAYPSRDVSPKVFRVTLWDNQSLDVYNYFDRWIHLMQHGEGGKKVNPVNYERDIRVRLLDTTGNFTTKEFLMKGAFPTEISETSLTYVESDAITFDVMFFFSSKIGV